MRPRVFVVEPYDRVDVSPAEEFGDIVYLFSVNGERSSIFDADYPEQVIDRLDTLRFDPDQDYIAVVGPMVSVSIAIACVFSRWEIGRLLVFNARDKEYLSITIGQPNETTS